MTPGYRRLSIVLLCALAPGYIEAQLVVIYDSGQSWPIDEFLGPVTRTQATQDEQTTSSAPAGVADVTNLLPIRSPGLISGDVKTRDYESPVPQAFFMIGSDLRSQHWLQRHRDRLQSLGAIGLLVQAESVEDIETIAKIAAGLPITPASGTEIARALGVTHYPFAIVDGRIWQ